jgi:DNA-binding LacI/PurR family transcriptional regulator
MSTYLQIYSDTKEKIQKGLLKPGQRIQPHRDLRGDYSVSIATVTRAINRLKKEGYVRSHRGLGTVVSEWSEQTGRSQNNTVSLVSYYQHFIQDAFSYTVQKVFAGSTWSIHSRCSHSNLEWYRDMLADCHKNPPAGMILLTLHPSQFEYREELLPKPCTKVVLMGHEIPGRQYDLVRNNIYANGRMLAEYLVNKGYRDFVFLTDAKQEELRVSECLKGMGEIFTYHEIPFGPEQYRRFENPHSYGPRIAPFEDSYNYVKKMLQHERPRVIITGHDWCAVGAIRAVLDLGLSIPEDIAVVSTVTECDLSVITATPKITTVDTLFDYRIRIAAETLKARLEGNEGPIVYHDVHGRICEGETA